MPSIAVFVDEDEIACGGASELNLLSASLCGGPFREQSLSVSGIGDVNENEGEHFSWANERIEVGQSIGLVIDDSEDFSDAVRSVARVTMAEIRRRIEELRERVKDRKPAPRPEILYPGLYYVVQVNSGAPVVAPLSGYDRIQAEVMWSRHQPEFNFKVMSVSVLPDGNTTRKYWLQETLRSGDRIRIEVMDAPDKHTNVAAASVA